MEFLDIVPTGEYRVKVQTFPRITINVTINGHRALVEVNFKRFTFACIIAEQDIYNTLSLVASP